MQAVNNTFFPIAYNFVNLLNTMAQMQSSDSTSPHDNVEGRKELAVKKPESNQVLCFCSMLPSGQLNVREFSMETKKSFGNCCEFEELNTIDTNYLITSLKHANKKDVWLIAKHTQTTEFRVFLLTANNTSSSPVISNVGKVISSSQNFNSVLKSNSATNRIVFKAGASNVISVYDFNSISGKITNPRIIEAYNGKSFAISNDGNKLYVSKLIDNQEKIFELDFKFGSVTAMQSNEKLLKVISNDSVRNLSITEDDRLLVTTQNPLNFALIYPSNLNKNGEYSRTQITKDCGCNENVNVNWNKKVFPTPYEWDGGTGPVIDTYISNWRDYRNLLTGRDTFSIKDYPLLNQKFNDSGFISENSIDYDIKYSFQHLSDGISFQFSDENNGINISLSVETPTDFDPSTIKYIQNVYPTDNDSLGNVTSVWVDIVTNDDLTHHFSATSYPPFLNTQPTFCRLQEEGTFHILDEQGNYLDLETCELVVPEETNYIIHEFNHLLLTENGDTLSLNTLQ